jgi:hypothetical protein
MPDLSQMTYSATRNFQIPGQLPPYVDRTPHIEFELTSSDFYSQQRLIENSVFPVTFYSSIASLRPLIG